MGMEGLERFDRKETREKTLLELKNEMQFAIALKLCDMDDKECITNVLEGNGENFHFAYDNVSSKYGDMYDLWENDRENTIRHLMLELEALKPKAEAA
jgi:hypothetical protein